MRTIALDDVRIAFREVGSGEPVLLLHGYPEDHRTWRHQVPGLSETHRVIAPDLPGWGLSTRDSRLCYDYASQLRRLTLFIESLGLTRLNLVAHDYGALLALGYAIEHPHRLIRLAILNSRAHGTFAPRYGMVLRAQCAMARNRLGAALLDRLPWYWIHRGLLARYRRNGSLDQSMTEAYLSWMKMPHGKRFLRRFYADYPVSPMPWLAKGLWRITCPATVIWGGRDPYCPVRIGRDLARELPDAGFELLPQADHFVHEEYPREVTYALRTLLLETTPEDNPDVAGSRS